MLNGSRLPSTDPNRRIVAARHLPGRLHRGAQHHQDLHARPAGRLRRRRWSTSSSPKPPKEFEWSINTSMSFNTETTFQKYDTYQGYPQDWLTFGDGPRQLPSTFDIVPQRPAIRSRRPDPTTTADAHPGRQPAGQLEHRLGDGAAELQLRRLDRQHLGTLRLRPGRRLRVEVQASTATVNNAFNSPSDSRSGTPARSSPTTSATSEPSSARCSPRSTRSTRTTSDPRPRPGQSPGERSRRRTATARTLSGRQRSTSSRPRAQYTANQLGFGALEGVTISPGSTSIGAPPGRRRRSRISRTRSTTIYNRPATPPARLVDRRPVRSARTVSGPR